MRPPLRIHTHTSIHLCVNGGPGVSVQQICSRSTIRGRGGERHLNHDATCTLHLKHVATGRCFGLPSISTNCEDIGNVHLESCWISTCGKRREEREGCSAVTPTPPTVGTFPKIDYRERQALLGIPNFRKSMRSMFLNNFPLLCLVRPGNHISFSSRRGSIAQVLRNAY